VVCSLSYFLLVTGLNGFIRDMLHQIGSVPVVEDSSSVPAHSTHSTGRHSPTPADPLHYRPASLVLDPTNQLDRSFSLPSQSARISSGNTHHAFLSQQVNEDPGVSPSSSSIPQYGELESDIDVLLGRHWANPRAPR